MSKENKLQPIQRDSSPVVKNVLGPYVAPDIEVVDINLTQSLLTQPSLPEEESYSSAQE